MVKPNTDIKVNIETLDQELLEQVLLALLRMGVAVRKSESTHWKWLYVGYSPGDRRQPRAFYSNGPGRDLPEYILNDQGNLVPKPGSITKADALATLDEMAHIASRPPNDHWVFPRIALLREFVDALPEKQV